MKVTESSPHAYRNQDRDYYFCSAGCKEKFGADPDAYLDSAAGGGRPAEAPVAGVRYTCPMHPEIIQDGPGSCPKCGMALEPLTPTIVEDDSELIDMRRRFLIGAARMR